MSSCIFRPVHRLACGGLSLGLLVLMIGCGKNPHSVGHTEVSGKVLFQGKPLPGGRLSFVAVNGGFTANGVINEDGTYKINAPIGEVKIGVDNTMLRPGGGGGMAKGGKKTAGPPQKMSHPKPPGAELKEQTVKGKWVHIPGSYADPATSGLTYTVTKGSQTHDIELPATPPISGQ